MRTTRGYIDQPLAIDQDVVLTEELANHLTRVLRLRSGDVVQLFNGDGREFRAVLTSLERKRTVAHVESEVQSASESPLRLTLAQGLCRGDKMDLVLQKATELGVHAIQPLLTERTEVRLDAERETRRMAHWRQVIASSCEQSGRAVLPALAAPLALPAWLAQRTATASGQLALMLDPAGEFTLRELPSPAAALLAIGPEGGFSDNERALLQRMGFQTLRLGPRILRTETAGLAAIAAMQSHWGDL